MGKAKETKASKTDAPVTVAPVTKAKETKAPKTDSPVTVAPVTKAKQTKAPETDAPVTVAPVTKAPKTEAPKNGGPVPGTIWINEFHYDDKDQYPNSKWSKTGLDGYNEFVEIAAPAGTDLKNFYLFPVSNLGNAYSWFRLTGKVPDQKNGYGTSLF